MTINFSRYSSLVFDCDGVILNSNHIKSEAFYNSALRYSPKAAQLLLDYHINNGGISRFVKFSYLLDTILPSLGIPLDLSFEAELSSLLSFYRNHVNSRLLTCERVPLDSFFSKINLPCSVISGGDQDDLRFIFKQLNIDQLFTGIYGSPRTKIELFNYCLNNSIIRLPALYFGDSLYDFTSSTSSGLDFIFVSDWSEFRNWSEFVLQHNIFSIPSIASLTNSL